MRAQWELRAVRHGFQRSPIRRKNGCRQFNGTHSDALKLARATCDYLRPRGVIRVEAWSCGELNVADDKEGEPQLVFVIRPHPNKRDWLADENELHHGGWFIRLQSAIDYALFRACKKVCAVHVLDAAGAVQQVILADNSNYDANPLSALNGDST